MWPSKKDKDIILPPGKGLEIAIGVQWRKDKDEVVIITDNEKFVLNGKNELFLEVTSSNAGYIKVQIIPDFKKRTISVVEVIDVNNSNVTGENREKISFAGVRESKDYILPIDKYLKKWDENIEKLDKKIRTQKFRRNLFLIIGAIAAAANIYIFTINNSPARYLNIVATIVIIYVSINLWKEFRELYVAYEKLKDQRLKVFEIAKKE
jgi:hypothetical protein